MAKIKWGDNLWLIVLYTTPFS